MNFGERLSDRAFDTHARKTSCRLFVSRGGRRWAFLNLPISLTVRARLARRTINFSSSISMRFRSACSFGKGSVIRFVVQKQCQINSARERARRIELPLRSWQDRVLPLYYARDLYKFKIALDYCKPRWNSTNINMTKMVKSDTIVIVMRNVICSNF